MQVPKAERKAAAAEILRDVKPSRDDLYLPVNAAARVLDIIPSSATPMQSAAKVGQRSLNSFNCRILQASEYVPRCLQSMCDRRLVSSLSNCKSSLLLGRGHSMFV